MKERTSSLNIQEKSLINLIESTINNNWDYMAYSDYNTDINYTFGDVALKIARLHSLYNSLGINKGDKIALCDRNSTHWAVSFLSIITYGAVAVPILADFSIEQVQNIIEHSESSLLITSRNVYGFRRTLNTADWKFFEESEEYASMYAAMDAVTVDRNKVTYDREDIEGLALISYTSGSTGRSKGVMLPYRSMLSNVLFADEKLGLPVHSKTMAVLPMAHMYGFAFDFMYEFCVATHVHFLTKIPSPQVIIKAFNEVKPDIVIAVPLIIEKIVTGKVFPVINKPAMKRLLRMPILKNVVYKKICKQLCDAFGGNFYEAIIGGAAFSKEVEDFLNRIGFPYTVGYGMTECGPIIAYEDWHSFAKGSCGKPAPRMEVRIDSEDPQNVAGEIITRGMNVMLGYYKNPEETKLAIDEEGWLHTGDLGTMDQEGNIFIRGRKKSMLLGANGQNVYPEELEDVINSYGAFDECVVVQRGEKFIALVYVSDAKLEAKNTTREKMVSEFSKYRSDINRNLPKFSQLAAIEMMENEFEKTPKHNIKRFLYK